MFTILGISAAALMHGAKCVANDSEVRKACSNACDAVVGFYEKNKETVDEVGAAALEGVAEALEWWFGTD